MRQELLDYIDSLTPNKDYPYFCTLSMSLGDKWNPNRLETPKDCLIDKCGKLMDKLDEKKISATPKECVDVFESEAEKEWKSSSIELRRRYAKS